jgi:hypothetical protein
MKTTFNDNNFFWTRDNSDHELLCPTDAIRRKDEHTKTDYIECIDITALEERIGKL